MLQKNYVNRKQTADVPLFEAIIAKPWGKEDELKALKSELATLDCKITAELAPKHDEKDGEEIKHDELTQQAQRVEATVQSKNSKESMVAEPLNRYKYPRVASGSNSYPSCNSHVFSSKL